MYHIHPSTTFQLMEDEVIVFQNENFFGLTESLKEVWLLLQRQPLTKHELIQELKDKFPDENEHTITTIVEDCLKQLLEKRLVIRSE